MNNISRPKKKLIWLTPDYFFDVDASVVPLLAKHYEINWILINTLNSKREINGLIINEIKPKELNLKYKQKDPRIIIQYIKLFISMHKSKYDLIYLSFEGPPFFFPLFFMIFNLNKVIYGAHNVTTPKGSSNERIIKIYQSFVLKRIKNIHVFSKFQMEIIKKMFPDKSHYYAPLALKDFGLSKTVPPCDTIRFLFFGYIREYKRLDILLNSFQELFCSGIQNIQLCIAGQCDNWEHYQSMIRIKSGIITRIEVIPNADIPDLISSCHYLILPYQDGAQSGVLPLAYQYNKPVIASDINAFKQFIIDGYNGFLFKSGSQDSLSSVMRKVILKHNSVYEILKNNISDFNKQEFSINQIVSKYIGFIDECIIKNNSTIIN